MEFTFEIDLDVTTLKQMEKSLKQINSRHIRFGWLDRIIHPKAEGLTVAQIAHYQEFGKSLSSKASIPARPYFRQAINKIRRSYNNKIKDVYVSALKGSLDEEILKTLSREVVKDYSESVLKQNYKKLSPYTVKLKGHSYQMDDSGLMIKSFSARVFRQNIKAIKD